MTLLTKLFLGSSLILTGAFAVAETDTRIEPFEQSQQEESYQVNSDQGGTFTVDFHGHREGGEHFRDHDRDGGGYYRDHDRYRDHDDDRRGYPWGGGHHHRRDYPGGGGYPRYPSGGNEQIVFCGSNGYYSNRCYTGGYGPILSVQIISQQPNSYCGYGSTWGYDSQSIWVSQGCSATFRVFQGYR